MIIIYIYNLILKKIDNNIINNNNNNNNNMSNQKEMKYADDDESEFNTGYFNYKDPYFPSGSDGTYIIEANSGAKFPWKVGTVDEYRFFRVLDSTATLSSNGHRWNGVKRANKLFYTSPESYMDHRNVLLDPEVVNNWYSKKKEMFPDM